MLASDDPDIMEEEIEMWQNCARMGGTALDDTSNVDI
jgi:hypothetical protein